MSDPAPAIHVRCRCDFCGETNEITAANVRATAVLHCSLCGNPLGPIGQLSTPASMRRRDGGAGR